MTTPESEQKQRGRGRRRRKERPKPKNWLHALWLNWIKPIGGAILVVFAFRWTIADWNDVPSGSMEPTILIDDRIFVNKLAYHLKFPFTHWRIFKWDTPERGEIVVFKSPEPGEQHGQRMVKRVVAIPGDTVEVRDNRIYINGEPLPELPVENATKFMRLDLSASLGDLERSRFFRQQLGDFTHTVLEQHVRSTPRYANFGPITVPEGMYFCMGDNRNNSRDSRSEMGLVPMERITGRAFGVAFSYDTSPSFAIRWERICRGFDQVVHDDDDDGAAAAGE